jgi:hypothetical protein
MQSYPFTLTPEESAKTIAAFADLFVYESGDITPRTNLLLNSADPHSAPWAGNAAVTPNYAAAPDGTITASRMQFSGPNQVIAQAPAGVTLGQIYSGAVWVKGNANETVIFAATGDDALMTFNGSWQRLKLPAQAAWRGGLILSTYGGATARDFLVWNSQLEPGYLVTEDIITLDKAVTVAVGDTRIKVKPENGGELVLKPGQRFRIAPDQQASRWYISSYDGKSRIAGQVIVGSGDFDDANTLNKVQLDASFANNVYVNNTQAQRIPVALDPNVPLNIAGQTVNYTNAFADATTAAGTVAVVTAAQNPNGMYVELAEISGSGGNNVFGETALVAKAGAAPASITDGDVLMVTTCAGYAGGSTSANYGFVNDRLPARVKVAAGKGLYLVSAAAWSTSKRTVLTTLL